EIWSHDQSFDQTPLLSKAHAGKALEAMLDFLAQEKVGLLSFDSDRSASRVHGCFNDSSSSTDSTQRTVKLPG
ncbi:hypothetical protein OAK98_04900, partial [Mariniblastus sp.]|nr:hypothetical protein [Mariniblastus sp.]